MRTALVNLAVLAALGLALVLGAELWLRLTIPPSSGESVYLYTLATPRYKLMKPNATVTAWGKELSTNDLGFRDAPVAPKQPGELRIVVLGDSFTVAAGVDRRDMWTGLVQQRLRKSFPQARVVNLAVGGYNVVQYRMVLEEVGLRLAPDLLLVALFPDNDFSMATYEENFRVASGEPQSEPPWHQRLYVYRAYLGRLEARIRGLFAKEKPAAKDNAGWNENAAALQAIADIARREKLPLAVALLPHTWHFERQRPLFARVGALCRQLQLACIDLLEPFIAGGLEESSLRLNALDAHPNEKYNAAAAAELAPHLERLMKEIDGTTPRAL
ncbi:MAG TPA: SGNH/GDSL hydrolase family protein [Burkholderiales bacterium]|nr:SGNH/GDSL hydrolase family protein [Burkholderiales bacterium]